MNKQDLVREVATRTGLNVKESKGAVKAVFETIQAELQQGNDVTVAPYGRFGVKERQARKGRNPQTGETIDIKATTVPSFKAYSALKNAVK